MLRLSRVNKKYMVIKRDIQEKIEKRLWQGKVIIIYGARRVGKTTLVKRILDKYQENAAYYNCEEGDVAEGLSADTSTALRHFFGDKKLIILDEAQKIKNIGTKIKLLVDNYTDMQIIATGSSSFDLSNSVNESLTGRFYAYHLYPFSLGEIMQIYSETDINRLLEKKYMRFGLYPETISKGDDEASDYMTLVAQSYLFKDVFSLQSVRNPEVLHKLVQLLALQIGNEVSLEELSVNLKVSIETVERYITILERAFVVFRLPAFSRNLRTEIKKSRKIYFYDCGIRNALIRNFNHLELRQDVGALWENFCIAERIKNNQKNNIRAHQYFWRTYDQKEIDYIEEYGGNLYAYEFKWNTKAKNKIPKMWSETYPGADHMTITRTNYGDFVLN